MGKWRQKDSVERSYSFQSHQKTRETSSQNENKILERARILCHQGHFGKAARILSSDGLAPSNEKTYEYLCSLHPEEKEPILPVTDEL